MKLPSRYPFAALTYTSFDSSKSQLTTARGVVALKDRLFGPVFEPLRDPALFRQVSVDEFGAVCWPNGADLAPDAMYEEIKAHGVWVLD